MILSADFETTTEPFYNKYGYTRVWLWGCVNLVNDEFKYGNDIVSFFEYIKKDNNTIYFHNLAFDIEFMLWHLLINGYTYSELKEPNTISTIIDKNGTVYSLNINFDNGKTSKIYDSFKKIPLKVEKIPQAFGLPEAKGHIDYDLERPEGYIPTQVEIDYLYHDCHIVAQALNKQFDQGLIEMTIGSDALNYYKNMIGEKAFNGLFPTLTYEADNFIRESYKGGFVYVNPKYKNYEFTGISYDVNSLYPSVYSGNNGPLPYGVPIYFEGEYQYDKYYPLYIVKLLVDFDIKPNHIPTIQVKNFSRFLATEYIEHSKGPIELTLTSPDLELFLEHYDINFISYLGGYKFQGSSSLFTDYANHWTEVKIKAGKENNAGLRTLAKLLLNNLYGKLALSTVRISKIPYMADDNTVEYKNSDTKFIESVYTACASFITAYARKQTIETAQKLYERFVYADTDSIHLIGLDVPDIPIDDYKLGYWKCEGAFIGKFLRAKTYIKYKERKIQITCAGMPDNVKSTITNLDKDEAFDTFNYGNSFGGKLMPKKVKGGVVLFANNFTIKK